MLFATPSGEGVNLDSAAPKRQPNELAPEHVRALRAYTAAHLRCEKLLALATIAEVLSCSVSTVKSDLAWLRGLKPCAD